MQKPLNIQIIGEKVWFKDNDEIWCYDIFDLASEGRHRKKAATTSPDQILAPMPGKVTRIFVNTSDSVEKSQPLLVMEAMKMEYTLKSDLITSVEQINVSVGQQVQLGEVLIQLKKAES